MKKSNVVATLLTGSVVVAMLHHNPVYRDRYATREDCLKDWGSTPSACEPEPSGSTSGGSSAGRSYYGPSYEEGSRPRTAQSFQVQSRQLITRGGFGASGARFSGGG
ncbi:MULTISPECIES: hypothetical protein [Pseudomonas]|uniref:hypothetical protein n=1 Tax=Pseudomonas TaxID=286 RepID=UPI000D6F16AB|nr:MULTISPECIES: hypothetical protein [unclassified Pseudomonas]PWU25947.1 hypothetical protein DK254_25345 [Pseudomonas sp. RW407]